MSFSSLIYLILLFSGPSEAVHQDVQRRQTGSMSHDQANLSEFPLWRNECLLEQGWEEDAVSSSLLFEQEAANYDHWPFNLNVATRVFNGKETYGNSLKRDYPSYT
ncbi:7449_t:CDS:1, partial [Acaulospora colombiana]